MKKEKLKQIFPLWKKSHRLDVLAGIAICILILNLSFIRPHIDKILYLAFYPSIMYGLIYAYNIIKIGRNLDKIKIKISINDTKEVR